MKTAANRFWVAGRARGVQTYALRRPLGLPTSQISQRPFCQTIPIYKRKKQSVEQSGGGPAAQGGDPSDLTKLEAEIQQAMDCLKDRVARLRSSGRFDPQLVEDLRVNLGRKQGEWAKLSNLAQVIPKSGRSLTVIVGEDAHIKAVSNAIMSSPHSLNPLPSPHSPLELSVPLPTPTQETRKDDLSVVTKAQERALNEIRDARGAHHKRLRAMEQARKVTPDNFRKGEGLMEKATQKGNNEVREVVTAAKKALQGQK